MVTENNINIAVAGAFTRGTSEKKLTLGIGYLLGDERLSITPSFIVGTQIKGHDLKDGADIFSGIDTDLDIKINKWINVSGKLRYLKETNKDFMPTYYIGLKIKL